VEIEKGKGESWPSISEVIMREMRSCLYFIYMNCMNHPHHLMHVCVHSCDDAL